MRIPEWSSALALTAALVVGACSPPSRDRPPNVVLIVIDDMGWADTGVYGSTFYETPNIDRLAAEGVRFTQFYTASPVCSPTRASLMTGRDPARLHLTNWIGGEQNGLLQQAEYIRALPHDEVTLGEAFRDGGYATGYIGKWHLGEEAHLPVTQGFDYNFAVNHAGQPGSYFPPYKNPNWALTDVPDLENDPDGAYLTDRLTDASVEFIEAHQEESFLLVLSHYAVHTPLQAPEEMVERYAEKAGALAAEADSNFRSEREASTKLRQDHAAYAAMVESADASVGRVVATLDSLDLDEQTIVMFVSDNGGLSTLLRRGFNQATSNEPLRAGKGWLYEGGIRAPLIVRWSGTLPGSTVVQEPAISTDVLPTLLDLAGMDPAVGPLDGISLANNMRTQDALGRGALFWHFPHYHGSGNRPGGAVRSGDLKLIEWFEDGAIELYDLSTDIGETRDLSTSRPADAQRLLAELRSWRDRVGAHMPTRDGS